MTNTNTEDPGAPAALPEPPGAPWVTMLTTLLVLLFFGGLVALMLYLAEALSGKSTAAAAGEQQLQELRAAEGARLENYGYDAAAKSFNIPIDRAMNILIDEAKSTGKLQSFPAKAQAK